MFPNPSVPLQVIWTALKDWWRDWVNLTALNLGWLVCWATIALGPPATFALYEIAHDFVRGRSLEYRELPGMLRRHFLKSWAWLLVNALVALGVWLNLAYYSRLGGPWGFSLLVLSALVAAGWLAVQFYALPYLMAQEQPRLRQAWRNALFTLLASPVYSLVLLAFAALVLALASRLVVLLFLGLPVLLVVLGAHAVAERLHHYRGAK